MKNVAWLLILLAGCHPDHDGEVVVVVDDAPPVLNPWYITYPNGHPIAASGPVSPQEIDIVNLINAHRVSVGLDALILHPPMMDVARAHSIHMGIHGFLSSINPEGDDERDRADAAGIFWFDYDEIVGVGTPDPFEMFDAWLDSPAHAVIDDPFWSHIGSGYDMGYWTVDFADR